MSDAVGAGGDATGVAVPPGALCGLHPSSRARYVCERCGTYACSDCVRFGERGEVWCASCEARAPSTIPWEQRGTIGWPRAIARTWTETVLSPVTFFSREPREAAVWPTVLYGMLFSLAVAVADLLVALLGHGAPGGGPFVTNPALRPVAWLLSGGFGVVMAALTPAIYLVQIYLMSGLWWVALRIVRAANEPFDRVVRVQSYANAVAILGVVRLLGPIVGVFMELLLMLWTVALQIIGHWRAQKTDLWRVLAAFGLLAVFVFAFACLCFSFTLFA